jgi:hypothetical protein
MNRSLKIAGLLLLGGIALPALLTAQERSLDAFGGVRDAANTARGALDAGRQAIGGAANRAQQGAANVQNRINEIGNRVLPSGQTNAIPQYQNPQYQNPQYQNQLGQTQFGQPSANSQFGTQLRAPNVPSQATLSGARDDREAPWRFAQQNGQWWYYSPDNQWMYYRDNQWISYAPNATDGQNNANAMASASDRNDQSDTASGTANSDQPNNQSNMQRDDSVASSNNDAQARSSGYRGVQPSGNQMGANQMGENTVRQGVPSYHVPGTYVLHRDAWGREYICVNGSQVFFNQSANSATRTMSKPQIDQPNDSQMQSGNAQQQSQSYSAAGSDQNADEGARDQRANETSQNQDARSSSSPNANSQDANAQDSNTQNSNTGNTDGSQGSAEETGLINGLFGGEENEGNSASESETSSSGPDVFEDN